MGKFLDFGRMHEIIIGFFFFWSKNGNRIQTLDHNSASVLHANIRSVFRKQLTGQKHCQVETLTRPEEMGQKEGTEGSRPYKKHDTSLYCM